LCNTATPTASRLGIPNSRRANLAGLEETRSFGKRPDLLLFPQPSRSRLTCQERGHAETETTVKQATTAIEVRSSKFEALTYMKVRQQQRAAGKTTARATPSFTVKVEDLVIVYRCWSDTACRKSYFQVFFDSVFAINFLGIFATIGSGNGFTIETPEKSQEKATIMIPSPPAGPHTHLPSEFRDAMLAAKVGIAVAAQLAVPLVMES